MHINQHAGKRMNQRGISRRLIDELEEELRRAKRFLDKGGVTVIETEGALITAYNVNAARF